MSDETVRAALRSDARLVVIEAPGGCGKTYQGAEYAGEIVEDLPVGRPLILTHTHAACSVFAEATQGCGRRVEIRTLDSLIGTIACAYHQGLGLPADVPAWIRTRPDGYSEAAAKVAHLVTCYPMIAAALARRHPIIVCDEHQDCSSDQHALVMALGRHGARLRIFADPMQKIFADDADVSSRPSWSWEELKGEAHVFEELDLPHRWGKGCSELGTWILAARAALKAGQKIDLRSGLPQSLQVIYAENIAQKKFDYRLALPARREIDGFKRSHGSLLVLSHYSETARALRGFFNRSIPLWEGHTRTALESLVKAMNRAGGKPDKIGAAVTAFLSKVGKGFSPSGFGDRLRKEARERCAKPCKGKPATLQTLAGLLVAEPNHRGVSKLLRRVSELRREDPAFNEIAIDGHKEFWDAVHLGDFETADAGLAEIAHRRTYSYPKPLPQSISTIHKAKGLECDAVIVMPCDASTFPDKPATRCLLYVALSRAMKRLMLVVSRENPSPLFML
jgi:DNA helicase-2/ATP-dependent DNA helicase PcrA